MGLFSSNFWNRKKTENNDPELMYLRAVQRLQKLFGNISPKLMSSKETTIQQLAELYHFSPGETAQLLITILHHHPESKDMWEEYLKRALKLAQTLGRTSCLTLTKTELKSAFVHFSQ